MQLLQTCILILFNKSLCLYKAIFFRSTRAFILLPLFPSVRIIMNAVIDFALRLLVANLLKKRGTELTMSYYLGKPRVVFSLCVRGFPFKTETCVPYTLFIKKAREI